MGTGSGNWAAGPVPAVVLSAAVCVAAGQEILTQDFDALQPGASLEAAGWEMREGQIRVGPAEGLTGLAIAGKRSETGVFSTASLGIRPSRPLEKYVLTFKARADAATHNSEVGFARADEEDVTPLAAWTRSNGSWRFDVRGIAESKPGQRELFPHVWKEGVDEPVTCRIVIDAGGHWVWGAISGADGELHRTHVFGLPYSQVGRLNALFIGQDAREGSGPFDVDAIRVTRAPAPPIVGTSADDWRLPEITIVEYSWTSADTTFIRHNTELMETLPLDGITVRVPAPRFPYGTILTGTGKGEAGWRFFQDVRLDREVFEAALADVKATTFRKFRKNYVNMVTYLPGEQVVDWFDDEWWGSVLHNTRLIARFANEAGCAGVMLDPEEYGCKIWGLPGLMREDVYSGRTAEETIAKVQARGREFARAFTDEFRVPQFYVLHAWEDVLSRTADDFERLTLQGRTLTMPFLDGMLEGSTDETVIMDGIENGYYVDEVEEFRIMTDRVRR